MSMQPLKQTNIFTAFQSWKSVANKQQEMKYQVKNRIIVPVVIDLSADTDSESDADTKITNVFPKPIKLENCKESSIMIGVNKPTASSTPQTSHSEDELDESSQSTIILEESDKEKTIDFESIVPTGEVQSRVIIQENILVTSSTSTNSEHPSDPNVSTVVAGESEGESFDQNKQNQEEAVLNIATSFTVGDQMESSQADDNSVKSSSTVIPAKNPVKKNGSPNNVTSSSVIQGREKQTKISNAPDNRDKAIPPIIKSPTKRKVDDSFLSLKKEIPGKIPKHSPEKESNRMNGNYLTAMNGQNQKKEVLNKATFLTTSDSQFKSRKADDNSVKSPERQNQKNRSPNKASSSSSVVKESEKHAKTSNASDKQDKVNKDKAIPTSIIKSPTKTKVDGSFLSPKKKIPETSPKNSPKKESKGMNKNYSIAITGLFDTVYNSPYLRTLVDTEKQLLSLVTAADPKYFYVCLKLCTWLPKWYNIFRFCEKIMVDMDQKQILHLYKFLKTNKIVDYGIHKEDLPSALDNLDKNQLKSICEKFKISKAVTSKSQMKKEDIIQSLLKYCNTQSTLLTKSAKDLLMEEVKSRMGYCIKVNDRLREAFYKVYLLGTFSNPALADIKDFFNVILNLKTVFPEYHVEDYMVFYSKEEFERYVGARKIKECMEESLKSKNHLDLLQQSRTVFENLKKLKINNADEDQDRYKAVPHLKRFTAEAVYVSSLSRVAEPLTTKFPKDVRDWLKYLITNFPTSHRLGDWYNQLIWLYIRYLKPDEYDCTATLIIKMLRSDVSDVQMHQMAKRAEQLNSGKKRKINQSYHDAIAEYSPEAIEAEHFPSTIVDATAIRSTDKGRKRKYIVQDSDGNKSYMTVENIALEYYIEECGYSDGKHCEGSLIKATFALFFWDIIYNPEKVVPGTFLSKFQNVPLDMYTTHFYKNRKNAIDKRLKEIESDWQDEKLVRFVKKSWDLHSHEDGFCRPDLKIEKPEFLETLVNCIGRKVLAKIYERLVKNLSLYSSGMPDLLVWEMNNKKCKFVEVKGENDTLSIKQKLWLKYLMSIGANIEVCHVHSMGSKRMKLKKSEISEDKVKLDDNKQLAQTANVKDKETPKGKEGNLNKEKKSPQENKPSVSKEKKTPKEDKANASKEKRTSKEKKAGVDKGKRNEKKAEPHGYSRKLDFSQFCETVMEVRQDDPFSPTESKKNKDKNGTSVCDPNTSNLEDDSGIDNETSGC